MKLRPLADLLLIAGLIALFIINYQQVHAQFIVEPPEKEKPEVPTVTLQPGHSQSLIDFFDDIDQVLRDHHMALTGNGVEIFQTGVGAIYFNHSYTGQEYDYVNGELFYKAQPANEQQQPPRAEGGGNRIYPVGE